MGGGGEDKTEGEINTVRGQGHKYSEGGRDTYTVRGQEHKHSEGAGT